MQHLGRFIGLVLAIAGLQVGQAELDSVDVSESIGVAQELTVTSFETGYGLPVVNVPEVPAALRTPTLEREKVIPVKTQKSCPFDVRAIVVGGEQVGSFATVVADGDSSIVRPGARPVFGGQRWRIKAIDNDGVVIERGGRTLRCPLGQ